MSASANNELCPTGISGLDDILGGGLPRYRVYLIEGDPGVGKTTLGLEFLLKGSRLGDKGLYITLSETKEELEAVAKSHDWSLDSLALFELSAMEEQTESREGSTFFHPSEIELQDTTKRVRQRVEEVNPARVVFDSLSELRLLAETPLRYRREILRLKQFFARRKCTVLLLDDRTSEASDSHVKSLAHGVICLEKESPQFGIARRRINVVKIRGAQFREGNHDFSIYKGRMQFFPRLVAAEHRVDFNQQTVSSGVASLDQLLGGGLDRGTSTVIMGAAGAGKSTIALQYVHSAASRGENVAVYLFDETVGLLVGRARGLGLGLDKFLDSGAIHLQQIDPAELPPGELVHAIRHQVERKRARVVVIDSLNGYLTAMAQEKLLLLQLHELFTYLAQQGVVTITVMAQQGMMGPMNSPVDLTYLADTVILLRYFEAEGEVKQAISVIKRRGGRHERTIREFKIDSKGIQVGKPLSRFHGVLTGTPTLKGASRMLKSR